MDWETFNAKKYKTLVKIIMPILAVLYVLIFILLPIWVLNTALRKEGEEKGREVRKIMDVDLIK